MILSPIKLILYLKLFYGVHTFRRSFVLFFVDFSDSFFSTVINFCDDHMDSKLGNGYTASYYFTWLISDTETLAQPAQVLGSLPSVMQTLHSSC